MRRGRNSLDGMRSEQCYEFWKLAHLSEVSIIHTEPFTAADVRDVIRLVKGGRMNIERLITHLVDVAEAPGIYDKIIHDPAEMLGIVFDWKKDDANVIRCHQLACVEIIGSD